nr:toluene-4-monooxygenase system protein B [Bordetella holmesii]
MTTMTDQQATPEVVPLNAIFSTDFVAILVPVTTANTMDEVAVAVAYHSEGRRVRARPYPKVVIHHGKKLPGHLTVAEANIKPLDHIAVEYELPAGVAE